MRSVTAALLALAAGILLVSLALPVTQSGAAPVLAPPAQTLGQITSPRDRASVHGLVPVEGSAAHSQFQKYELHYGPEPNAGDQWTPVGGSPFTVPVVQGRLALWDTTVIPDGLYSLRLRIVRLDGNYDEYFVRGVQVVNTRPTETATPQDEERATPTPSAPTRTPAPTLTVVIGVPTVASPTPRPSATPLPTAPPKATAEPMDLPFQSVSDAACKGVGLTLALFVGIGLFFALKGWLVSFIRWLTRRGRESMGLYDD
jgi:hypothetical protein